MPTSRRDPGTLLPYLGLASMIGAVIWTNGQQTEVTKHNTERIIALEASDKARSDAINRIDLRGARIEAKMDLEVDRGGK